MLVIKEQMSLQSLRGIHLTPTVLNDRIGVLYNVMNLDISAEDFLHLISNPPEIYLAESENMTVSIQNNIYNQKLKMEMMNQLVNHLLLLQNNAFTYQDTIYVTTILEKLGIKQVNELLWDIKKTLSETKNIQRLTELYWYNGRLIKQQVENTKAEEPSNKTTIREKPNQEIEQKRYYLHNDIYHRLETAIIYNDVYEQVKQYGAVSETINHMELCIAEQMRVSGALLLSELRKEYASQKHKTIEFHINQYEAGTTEQKEFTRENILSNLVSAVLISLTDNIYQIRNEQMKEFSMQYEIVQALYRSMDNTIKRYEIYHTQELPAFIKQYDYSNNINQLYHYEIELLEEVSAENSEIMTEIHKQELQSGYWEQELIYYIQQNQEYDLSREQNQTLTELAVNYLDFQQKLQYIQHQLTEDRITSSLKEVYQNIINEIKQTKEENLTEESHLLVNDIMVEVIKQYQKPDISVQEVIRKTSEKQRARINEIINIHDFVELLQERFLINNDTKINDLKYSNIRQKLKQTNHHSFWTFMSEINDEITMIDNKVEKNITEKIFALKNTLANSVSIQQSEYEKQTIHNFDAVSIQNYKQGDIDESIENQEHNQTIMINSKSNETIQNLISKETTQVLESVLQPSLTRITMETQDILFQNENFRDEMDIHITETEQNVTEQQLNYDMTADIDLEKTESNSLNQSQNQTFLQALQQINQKNIEMNQRYLQQKSNKNNTYSTLQVDAKRTMNEALKVIYNSADQKTENKEYKSKVLQPEIIDERIRNLASKETIQIFETILGDINKEPEHSQLVVYKASETELLSQLHNLEQQINHTSKQTYQTSESMEVYHKEIIENVQRLPEEIYHETDKSMRLIHKEQENYIEEELLQHLVNQKNIDQKQENHVQEVVTNHMVETKEIQQQQRKMLCQSEEELSELVQKKLQGQIGIITDRVFNRIEKKLQMERRRRGY